MICPQNNWSELDPLEVFKSVNHCIKDVVTKVPNDSVKALSYSVLGAGIIPINKDKKPLYNCITALDNRSLNQVEKLNEGIGKENIYKITGMPSHPFCAINKIMWLKENMRDVFNKTWKFLNLEEFILLKWGINPVIDYSVAGSTMALDINDNNWSNKILNFVKIDKSYLPELINSGSIIGEVNNKMIKELGLNTGTKIVVGGHDQACGVLGAGVYKKGIALDSTGTVEAIVPVTNKPFLSYKMLNSMVFWEHHVAPNLYIGVAANFCAGSALRWFRDVFGKYEMYEAVKNKKNVYDLLLPKKSWKPSEIFTMPHFSGSVSPWGDPKSKGIIIGITLATKKEDIAKSIIDGVTYEAKRNVENFESSGIKINELRAIGGACNDKKWLQLKADIIGKPITIPSVTEASSLGAAILAGIGIGIYKSFQEAIDNCIEINEEYLPNEKNYKLYEEKYRLYTQIHPLIKEFLHLI